jgi:hypothetical protein
VQEERGIASSIGKHFLWQRPGAQGNESENRSEVEHSIPDSPIRDLVALVSQKVTISLEEIG